MIPFGLHVEAIVDDILARSMPSSRGSTKTPAAPERLLRASLLQAFYSVRSEQLMEQIGCNILFRWFVGLGMDDCVWDHLTFSKNRDRLLDADVAGAERRAGFPG